jgi:hypothetical protein
MSWSEENPILQKNKLPSRVNELLSKSSSYHLVMTKLGVNQKNNDIHEILCTNFWKGGLRIHYCGTKLCSLIWRHLCWY